MSIEATLQSARRLVASLAWYGILVLGLVIAAAFLDAALRATAANWMSLGGMLLLAAPTIRLNEQGRRIWRLRSLVAALEAQEKDLEAAPPEQAAEMGASIADSRARLRKAEQAVLDEKGGWTPTIHRILYGGYALFFASALTRLL